MKDGKMHAERASARPYFIWNADLTEEDVRRILAFAQPASAPFALHGGTALAAFYLHQLR